MTKKYTGFLTGIKDLIKSKFGWFIPVDSPNAAIHSFSKRKSRTYLTRNETLQLDCKTKLKIVEINKEAKDIFKKLFKNPDDLLSFIESQGTLVIKAPHMEKVLLLLGESEGFILPMTGLRAFFLTTMINILSRKKVTAGFESPAMFAMRDLPVNVYYMAHQFHHWLSYNNGLPGYDESTSINFKTILSSDFGSDNIRSMSIDEILSLKEAISRDVEAIKFVKEISRELIGARNSATRLKNGESLNL